MGQQTFEIILSGYQSLEEAAAALRKRLPDLVRVENPPVVAVGQELTRHNGN